ncbi:MAG: glutamate--tRNA ligase [Clostridia bacterium]|nr:glutamate--tRNA ligase [Clostridia bacterium]
MDYQRLAALMFPQELKTPEEYEALFPVRNLPEGAKITRMAPSPTGFMHLGNLFGAIVDERLAHLSGGKFILRIEDTDLKRQVPGAVELITRVFGQYGLNIDEGVTSDGEIGEYGPYYQRQRAPIYQAFAKKLVLEGKAYPCFCTEQDLENMRNLQEQRHENPGYYGEYAVHRDMDVDTVEQLIKEGKPFVVRFRSTGDPDKTVTIDDQIKGKISVPENNQDFVLLKSDGIPTYHFAHVVDDHLMRTSVVVRGEEWLSTLNWHIQLFGALGFKMPKFAHTSHMMKVDGDKKRKLSKRKDPEASLDFYRTEGYPPESVKEYLMTVINSNFEDWRIANPTAPLETFPFSLKKMSVSGTLFDMDKFRDVSKNVIARMSAEEVYDRVVDWAQEFDQDLYNCLTRDPDYAKSILAIGRGGKKPRKDLALWSEVKDYLSFFYDELFNPDYTMPENVAKEDVARILADYGDIYNPEVDMTEWFNAICQYSGTIGFASSTKEYKQNPEQFRGSPGDTSMVLRVAVCGRQNSPDLFSCMQILGADKVKARLQEALNKLN